MAQAKYITGEVKTVFGPIATAICFGEVLSHDQFARMFDEIWGAGFFYISDDGTSAVVHGHSVSLNAKSRGEQDVNMINKALGLTFRD